MAITVIRHGITLDEIAGWGQLDDGARRRVVQGLRARRIAKTVEHHLGALRGQGFGNAQSYAAGGA